MFTAPVHSDLQRDPEGGSCRLQGFADSHLPALALTLAALAVAQLTT